MTLKLVTDVLDVLAMVRYTAVKCSYIVPMFKSESVSSDSLGAAFLSGLSPKCPDTSAPGPKCPMDTSDPRVSRVRKLRHQTT